MGGPPSPAMEVANGGRGPTVATTTGLGGAPEGAAAAKLIGGSDGAVGGAGGNGVASGAAAGASSGFRGLSGLSGVTSAAAASIAAGVGCGARSGVGAAAASATPEGGATGSATAAAGAGAAAACGAPPTAASLDGPGAGGLNTMVPEGAGAQSSSVAPRPRAPDSSAHAQHAASSAPAEGPAARPPRRQCREVPMTAALPVRGVRQQVLAAAVAAASAPTPLVRWCRCCARSGARLRRQRGSVAQVRRAASVRQRRACAWPPAAPAARASIAAQLVAHGWSGRAAARGGGARSDVPCAPASWAGDRSGGVLTAVVCCSTRTCESLAASRL